MFHMTHDDPDDTN